MAFDAFGKVDGIPGESTDAGHKDWIEVLNYSHELTQPASASASTAGGATSERCQHGDFVFTHYLDKASPKLAEACCKGTHIKEITFELCRAGGDKVKYMEIKLGECVISSIRPVADPKGAHGFPVETVAINYGTIGWTYTQQKRADGSGGGNVAAGWSLIENKPTA